MASLSLKIRLTGRVGGLTTPEVSRSVTTWRARADVTPAMSHALHRATRYALPSPSLGSPSPPRPHAERATDPIEDEGWVDGVSPLVAPRHRLSVPLLHRHHVHLERIGILRLRDVRVRVCPASRYLILGPSDL
jgi:hypothetical protein